MHVIIKKQRICFSYQQDSFSEQALIIDDTLMADVLKTTGIKTKREAVEFGLKTLLMLKQQEGIKAFKGQLKWEGNLEQMRTDH